MGNAGLVTAGVACCAVTGLLISPFSWTHHWVWVVPLLVLLSPGRLLEGDRYVLCGLAVLAAAAAVLARERAVGKRDKPAAPGP